jgi:hypothetical protein
MFKPTSIPEKQVSTFKSISLEQIGLHLCQSIGTNWLYVGQWLWKKNMFTHNFLEAQGIVFKTYITLINTKNMHPIYWGIVYRVAYFF